MILNAPTIQKDKASTSWVVDNLPDTVIGLSYIHGHGLHAKRVLVPGQVLGWLDGQRMDWSSFEALKNNHDWGKHAGHFFVEWNALSKDTLLVRPFRTKYGFINHSRSPNLVLLYEPLRVVVNRHVMASSELTLDYREEPLRPAYFRSASFL